MKRNLSLILVVCMVMCLFSGCGGNTPENTTSDSVQSTSGNPTQSTDTIDPAVVPGKEKDYFELLCENCDMTVYLGNAYSRFVEFILVSTRKLDNKTVTICSDIGEPFEAELIAYSKSGEVLPFEVFLSYQGVSWDRYTSDPEALKEVQAQYQEAYGIIAQETPSLYSYRVAISFNQLGIPREGLSEAVQLQTITVTIDEQSKTYSIGNMQFLPDKLQEKTGGGLNPRTLAISSYPVQPSGEGTVTFSDLEYFAKNDITLQSLSYFGSPDNALLDCRLVITTAEGDSYNTSWDGCSPVEIDAGSSFLLTVSLNDPGVANKLVSNVLRNLMIDYTFDGEEYNVCLEIYCRIQGKPHDVYAWKIDGVDMLPYYVEYLSATPKE